MVTDARSLRLPLCKCVCSRPEFVAFRSTSSPASTPRYASIHRRCCSVRVVVGFAFSLPTSPRALVWFISVAALFFGRRFLLASPSSVACAHFSFLPSLSRRCLCLCRRSSRTAMAYDAIIYSAYVLLRRLSSTPLAPPNGVPPTASRGDACADGQSNTLNYALGAADHQKKTPQRKGCLVKGRRWCTLKTAATACARSS